MKRQIIRIDADKCNGCGLCVSACHEGAIGIENGKAKLLRDDYCDGLGNCLPACPTKAISFEEREAAAYDAEGTKQNAASKNRNAESDTERRPDERVKPYTGECPGSRMRHFSRTASPDKEKPTEESAAQSAFKTCNQNTEESSLMQWPVQIKLVPVNAPYFQRAKLLVAADCTAFAYASFHRDFIRDHITIIGCPKLDAGDYTEKLTTILTENDIQSLTIVRMEVPCCGGLANAATEALRASGKFIPWQIVTISTEGKIM